MTKLRVLLNHIGYLFHKIFPCIFSNDYLFYSICWKLKKMN